MKPLLAELACIDIWGLNVYRWDESHTALADFAQVSDKPMYFSELGADSYMTAAARATHAGENQRAQADATQILLEPIFDGFHARSRCRGLFLHRWVVEGGAARSTRCGRLGTGQQRRSLRRDGQRRILGTRGHPPEQERSLLGRSQSLRFNAEQTPPRTWHANEELQIRQCMRRLAKGGGFRLSPGCDRQWNASNPEGSARASCMTDQRKQKNRGIRRLLHRRLGLPGAPDESGAAPAHPRGLFRPNMGPTIQPHPHPHELLRFLPRTTTVMQPVEGDLGSGALQHRTRPRVPLSHDPGRPRKSPRTASRSSHPLGPPHRG